jgi:hypothetical protein
MASSGARIPARSTPLPKVGRAGHGAREPASHVFGTMYATPKSYERRADGGLHGMPLNSLIAPASTTPTSCLRRGSTRHSHRRPTAEVSLYAHGGTLQPCRKARHEQEAAYLGSFGWGGCAKRETQALTEKLNWMGGTMEVQGAPTTRTCTTPRISAALARTDVGLRRGGSAGACAASRRASVHRRPGVTHGAGIDRSRLRPRTAPPLAARYGREKRRHGPDRA